MDKSLQGGMRQVSELLRAHARGTREPVSETVSGLVTVTVDAHLQLTSVRLHDASIDECKRQAIEQAIVEAVNGARQKAVGIAGESLATLRNSAAWKSAMDGLFGGDSPAC